LKSKYNGTALNRHKVKIPKFKMIFSSPQSIQTKLNVVYQPKRMRSKFYTKIKS
jgi:hypothetical protein